MLKRLPLLILPITIIGLMVTAIYAFFFSAWHFTFTVLIIVLFFVAVFAAYQSMFIQTSLIHFDSNDADAEERDNLSKAIAIDFLVFFGIYAAIVLMLFWFLS